MPHEAGGDGEALRRTSRRARIVPERGLETRNSSSLTAQSSSSISGASTSEDEGDEYYENASLDSKASSSSAPRRRPRCGSEKQVSRPKRKRGRPPGAKDKKPRKKRNQSSSLGRPITIPESLPIKSQDALDERLTNATPVATTIRIDEERSKRRQINQEEVAESRARPIGKRMVYAMNQACRQSEAKAAAELRRANERRNELEAKLREARNLRIAYEAGEIDAADVQNPQTRKALELTREKKFHHVSEEERRGMQELAGEMSLREIATKFGRSVSTISRQLDSSRVDTSTRRPRNQKMTPRIRNAAARFRFMFNAASLDQVKDFIERSFGVSISTRTINRHLRKEHGFRLGDFRRFPRERNGDATLEKRKTFAATLDRDYPPKVLQDAIYVDEMKLTRESNRRLATIIGWRHDATRELGRDEFGQITLFLAVCPDVGVIHWKLVEGKANANVFIEFMQEMYEAYVKLPNEVQGKRRLMLLDNAPTHKTKAVQHLLNDQRDRLDWMYLPPYSPFLNAIEEVFALIQLRMFQEKARRERIPISKRSVKESLIRQIEWLHEEEQGGHGYIVRFANHVQKFMAMARRGEFVFSSVLYEDSHLGDEYSCMRSDDDVEDLLDSYLPTHYAEYTNELRRAMQDRWGNLVNAEQFGGVNGMLWPENQAQGDGPPASQRTGSPSSSVGDLEEL